MGSKVLREGYRYKAKLDEVLRDGRVSAREAKAIERDARDGEFSQVQAHYLSGFASHEAVRRSPAAAPLVTFVKEEMVALAALAEERGVVAPSNRPAISPTGQTAGARYGEHDGKLVVDGVNFDDPVQGQVGDCYLVSALSALALTRPSAIRDAVRPNGDGTFTVTFFERGSSGRSKKVELVVDATVPRRDGEPHYASGRDVTELWPVLIEKAYAAWKGSYLRIEGGMSCNAFEALTGKKASWFPVGRDLGGDALFDKLKRLHDSKAALVVISNPWTKKKGMSPDHAYTVLSVFERDGERFVKLRNPWGWLEPRGDGVDDGRFELSFDSFLSTMSTVEFLPK